MIILDIEMPKGWIDCPFAEEDQKTNIPCCYLRDYIDDDNIGQCVGVCTEGCPIKEEYVPSAQPEITDEQAIEHLQSTGWMQNHDREMYHMGLKEQLADDSGSYASLLPSAHPEEQNCPYCHEDSEGYVKPIEKNCHALVRFGMGGFVLSLRAKGWHGEAKINYCPVCGRRLR